jgi:hypothetical protein
MCSLTQPNPVASTPPAQTAAVARIAGDQAELLRRQLVATSRELYKLLDQRWQSYLALPSQISGEHPSAQVVQHCLDRFDAVAGDPKYSNLSSRPEFQAVHDLLRHYQVALSHDGGTLPLPAPPPTHP